MRRNEPSIDRLPELTLFRDNGCDIHSSCLSCPLPQCRYDDPGWMQREERGQRDTQILQARAEKALPVHELAARFGVSTRTVHRVLRRTDEERRVLVAS
jgi:AraC-like DNA-binding protein